MNDIDSTALESIIATGDRSGVDSLPYEHRIIYLVAVLDTSIQMEGIEDYLQSHRGGLALEAANALQHIGALQAARLIREACTVFPSGVPPADWNERRQALAQIDSSTYKHLGDLSDAYLEYPDDLGTKFELYLSLHTITRDA